VEVIEYNLVLPEFEGPLDLLLHLVKKHELDIFNIPISFITTKYIQTLQFMQAVNMDLAGEYLLMAATLAYIKSRELLPPDAIIEDPDLGQDELGDPREALLKRLLEYQKFKRAGQELALRPVMGRNVWGRGARAIDVVAGDIISDAPLAEVPVWELIELLATALTRTRRKISHEVTVDRLSLADRINELTERLEKAPRLEFVDLLRELSVSDGALPIGSTGPFTGQIVMTFMAVLEMARLRLLSIYQAEEMGSIYISRATGAPMSASAQLAAEHAQPELPFTAPAEPPSDSAVTEPVSPAENLS
jgi:segregation and condensation protein A